MHIYVYRSDESTKWRLWSEAKKKSVDGGRRRRGWEGGKHAIALRNSIRKPTNLT